MNSECDPEITSAARERGRILADTRRDQLRLRLVPDARASAPAARGYCTIAAGVRRALRGAAALDRRELARIVATAELRGGSVRIPTTCLIGAVRRRRCETSGATCRRATTAASRDARRRRRRIGSRARRRALGGGGASPTSPPTTGVPVPFLKRAQIAAADLAPRRASSQFPDLERLTMFADNLVPHVLRLDGDPPARPRPWPSANRTPAKLLDHGAARGGRAPRLRRPRRRAADRRVA